MSEDWTSSLRIGRRIGRRLRAMSSGIGAKGSDITPRRSYVTEVNMQIGKYTVREDDAPKGSDEAPNELMTCRTTYDSCL